MSTIYPPSEQLGLPSSTSALSSKLPIPAVSTLAPRRGYLIEHEHDQSKMTSNYLEPFRPNFPPPSFGSHHLVLARICMGRKPSSVPLSKRSTIVMESVAEVYDIDRYIVKVVIYLFGTKPETRCKF